MNKSLINTLGELRSFLLLWVTQSLSALGSAMTSFALVIWAYQQTGSAVTTSLLTVCSYAPYVALSLFAGAFCDRWNKRAIMLCSDTIAALCTLFILCLLGTGQLQVWHLYLVGVINGLMNTVQQPASDVAITLLCPKEHYQKVSGLRSLSNSLVTIAAPVFASILLAYGGIGSVLLFDLITFLTAFLTLFLAITIPETGDGGVGESLLHSVKSSLHFLKENRGILDLILFMALINLTASVYNAALPAMVLSRPGGGEMALGLVNTASCSHWCVGCPLLSACAEKPPHLGP